MHIILFLIGSFNSLLMMALTVTISSLDLGLLFTYTSSWTEYIISHTLLQCKGPYHLQKNAFKYFIPTHV